MTREEAIYCMTTYLPNSDHSIYDCPKCKYYKSGCKSSEAHKLAIKALGQDDMIDDVLEIIDRLNDTKALADKTPLGHHIHKTLANEIKQAVLALKGGEG